MRRCGSSGVRGLAWLLAAALLVQACGGADGPGSGEADPGSDDPAADGAVLAVLDPGVDVADEPDALTAATFRAGSDGESLVVDDVVRTDPTGFAEVTWIDGALARVDADTTYILRAFDATPDAVQVATELDAGRVWSRVRADRVGGYEVRTDVGTAAIRGTAFWVACTQGGPCTFAVLEGSVAVTTLDRGEVLLAAGEQVTLEADGSTEGVVPADADDPWVVTNATRDEDAGFAALTPVGPPGDGGAALAGECPLPGLPDDFVAEDGGGPCHYVDPDPELGRITEVEFNTGGLDLVESFRFTSGQAEFESVHFTVESQACNDGMREFFTEFDEPLGQGRFVGFSWRVSAGPLVGDAACLDGTGGWFFAVEFGGEVYQLVAPEVVGGERFDEQCQGEPDPPGRGSCLTALQAELEADARAVAAVLLGA